MASGPPPIDDRPPWPLARRAVALASVGALGIWTGFTVFGATVTRPARSDVGAPPPALGADAIRFESGSGATLAAWAAEGRPGGGAVVLLHGIRSSREVLRGRALLFHDAGYAVLAADLQAHGESTGDRITLGDRERFDAVAAVAEARRRFPGERVAVVGLSLGGAAALLAGDALDADVLVLEAVYPDIHAATRNRLRKWLGPLGPPLLPLLLRAMPSQIGIHPDDLRPVDAIRTLDAPVLVVAGTEDRLTLPEDSWRLYQAARAPKSLWWVEGGVHEDYHALAPDDYRTRVLGFLEQHLRRAGP
ncbi:MAG: alpha/beta fold hydrolase [Rubricoccaceae bacterium]|nr:alpha/beta fold hydrolase [Rubricoccaceae bacterium]